MEHVNCIKFAAHLVFRKIMTTLLASQPLYIKIIGSALVSSLRRSKVLLFVNILFLRIFCSFWKYTYNNSIFVLQIINKPVELFFVYRKQENKGREQMFTNMWIIVQYYSNDLTLFCFETNSKALDTSSFATYWIFCLNVTITAMHIKINIYSDMHI